MHTPTLCLSFILSFACPAAAVVAAVDGAGAVVVVVVVVVLTKMPFVQ